MTRIGLFSLDPLADVLVNAIVIAKSCSCEHDTINFREK